MNHTRIDRTKVEGALHSWFSAPRVAARPTEQLRMKIFLRGREDKLFRVPGVDHKSSQIIFAVGEKVLGW